MKKASSTRSSRTCSSPTCTATPPRCPSRSVAARSPRRPSPPSPSSKKRSTASQSKVYSSPDETNGPASDAGPFAFWTGPRHPLVSTWQGGFMRRSSGDICSSDARSLCRLSDAERALSPARTKRAVFFACRAADACAARDPGVGLRRAQRAAGAEGCHEELCRGSDSRPAPMSP